MAYINKLIRTLVLSTKCTKGEQRRKRSGRTHFSSPRLAASTKYPRTFKSCFTQRCAKSTKTHCSKCLRMTVNWKTTGIGVLRDQESHCVRARSGLTVSLRDSITGGVDTQVRTPCSSKSGNSSPRYSWVITSKYGRIATPSSQRSKVPRFRHKDLEESLSRRTTPPLSASEPTQLSFQQLSDDLQWSILDSFLMSTPPQSLSPLTDSPTTSLDSSWETEYIPSQWGDE